MKMPKNRKPTKPGVILREVRGKETQKSFATRAGLSTSVHVCNIELGAHGITPRTAVAIAKATKTTPFFWLNLQNVYDLWEAGYR